MQCAWITDAIALHQYAAIFQLIIQVSEILGIDHVRVCVYYCHQQFAVA